MPLLKYIIIYLISLSPLLLSAQGKYGFDESGTDIYDRFQPEYRELHGSISSEFNSREILGLLQFHLGINEAYGLSLKHQVYGPVSVHTSWELTLNGMPVLGSDIRLHQNLQGEWELISLPSFDLSGAPLTSEFEFDDKEQIGQLVADKELEWVTEKTWLRSGFNSYESVLRIESFSLNSDFHKEWIIDHDGKILHEIDLIRYLPGDSTVKAKIFLPDPLTSSGTTYGPPYVDASDSDLPQLNTERVTREMSLTIYNDSFYLKSPFFEIKEFSAPAIAPYVSANPNLDLLRSHDGFEDVNVFYHLARYKMYIDSLGFPLLGIETLEVDAHALNGDDNSMFSSANGNRRLFFGEGGVDDGEDADVIIHEYGHALSHSAAPGSYSGFERRALDESYGDYFASSYSRSINGFDWEKVFTWDGHNEFWNGRTSSSTKRYPSDLNNSIHSSGEIWSSTLMQVWEKLGQVITDRLVFQSLYLQASGMSMRDAARNLIEADSLLYGGTHTCDLLPILCARGLLDSSYLAACPRLDQNLQVSAGEDQYICPGEKLFIGSDSIPGITYQWTPASLVDNPRSSSTIFIGDESAELVIQANSFDGRFNSDTIFIQVENCPTLISNTVSFDNDGISIYINPLEAEGSYIRLFDIQGREILNKQGLGGFQYIRSGSLSPGHYLLNLETPYSSITEKVQVKP